MKQEELTHRNLQVAYDEFYSSTTYHLSVYRIKDSANLIIQQSSQPTLSLMLSYHRFTNNPFIC